MAHSRKAFLLILLVLITTVTTVSAQQPTCSLRIDQLPESPELRGFHLGMSHDQVTARVPQIKFSRPDRFGIAKTSINPSFDPRFDKSSFADVRTISLEFLEGKLVTLWIGYEDTFKWQRLDDFVAGFSKSLNLPDAWSPKRGGRMINCEGFSVFASIIAGSPSIRIADEAAQDSVAKRREAAAEADEAIVIGDRQTRLYYASDCSTLEKVPQANRVSFKDREEAEKAGYSPAKDCQQDLVGTDHRLARARL